jgi:tRNA(Ile)-lysidine synthase TilS/MesJ
MRCAYCNKEAEIYVENLGSWVCEEHFERYFLKRVDRVLRRVRRGSSLLFGISGGKDSIAAIHSTGLLKEKYGFRIGAVMIYTGSDECLRVFNELKGMLGFEGEVLSLRDWGIEIPRDPKLACFVCGVVNRYLLNRYAVERGYDYVATGHNLDDMAYFGLNNLIKHSLDYLLYQYDSVTEPVPELRMAGKVKPLFWLSDSDSLSYVKLKGLPRCSTKCPDGLDKQAIIKPILYEIRKKWPPSLVNFVSSIRELVRMAEHPQRKVNLCERCGYPTSGKICAFCRLKESMGGLR